MSMKFIRSQRILGFKEGKPTMYKIAQLNYATVTQDELVNEAARSCGMNKTMMKAALEAIVDRVCHYVGMGHAVQIGEFGTVKPIFTSKMQKTADDLSADNVRSKKVRFYAGQRLKDVVKHLSVTEYGLSDNTLLEEDDDEKPTAPETGGDDNGSTEMD